MIKVTCQISDYSIPAQPEIKIHNHWADSRMVEIEIDGKRYTVSGRDMIQAIQNCMVTNS